MARYVITLNGKTLLDDPLSTWQQRPPESLRPWLNPTKAKSQPWTIPAMVILSTAVTAMPPQSLRIDVLTSEHGYQLNVGRP